MDSPIGPVEICSNGEAVVAVSFCDEAGPSSDHPFIHAARRQLEEYFEGERMVFDLPLELQVGGFIAEVLEALKTIPYAETRSYGQIACQIGQKSAARAVGRAVAKNPIDIIIPCHRVIAAGGRLGGYHWGVLKKRWLLEHEARKRRA